MKAKVWKQDTLSREVLTWWKQFRPLSYSIFDHVKNPTVNTAGERNARLAKIAAKIMKSKMEKKARRK